MIRKQWHQSIHAHFLSLDVADYSKQDLCRTLEYLITGCTGLRYTRAVSLRPALLSLKLPHAHLCTRLHTG
jgi:hypothetical protein